jgi:flagellin
MASVDVTRVAGNIGALNALQSLQLINNELAIHQTRLATGKRLNSAADDPAGMNMAITFDIRRNDMKTALSAIGDAKNLLATAEGGLKKISDILVKMKTVAMQAKGDTLGTSEKAAIATQLNSYASEIDQIVDATKWNNTDLIGSDAKTAKKFLVGVDGAGAATTASFSFSGTVADTGFTTTGLSLKTDYASATDLDATNIDTTLKNITDAVSSIKSAIVDTGAFTARLTFKEEAMNVTYANTESAYNRIMNANMAEEQVEVSKNAILQQTATAMLAQANAGPQFILSLFK